MLLEEKKLFNEFDREVKAVNGVIDMQFARDSNEVILVGVCLNKPATDENCVASIDWLPDTRYHGRRTFNVCTYNENFSISSRDHKRAKKLQMIAVKYSNKFWKLENK